jgi:alpha-D-glucose phosphate-specific phosphoglucomutase
MSIKFGTDGWRAVIAEDFTFDNVRVCAQAVASYLKDSGLASRGLLIGYDTRFASEDFAAATAEVVAANDIKVYLCDKATPTPVVSFGVWQRHLGGAVIITASHNPRQWNGFKIKSETGSSAAPEITAKVEKHIGSLLASGGIKRIPLEQGTSKGNIEYIDLSSDYIAQLSKLVDLDGLRSSRLLVAVDSMHGAGAGYTKRILSGGSIKITETNSQRNPNFPGMGRPEPIAVNLTALSALVRRHKANVGLSTDGDADRVGIMDEKCNFLNQLQVYALLALYLLEVREQRGPLVKTVTAGSMPDLLGKIFNVPVHETQVGFRYVGPKMLETEALMGGEESGGYGFRGHVLERDGLLAGLFILDFMVKTGKTASQLLDHLFNKVGPHYYNRFDVEFSAEQRQAIMARVSQFSQAKLADRRVVNKDTLDGFRFHLDDGSWLLIRLSGTEPLLRFYAESDKTDNVEKLLEAGRKLAGV